MLIVQNAIARLLAGGSKARQRHEEQATSSAPRSHMSLPFEHRFTAPDLVKQRLLARPACAKCHVGVGHNRQNGMADDGRRGGGLVVYRV